MKITIKKSFVFAIALANIGFLLCAFYLFYYKEASFDTSKRTDLDSNKISKIHNRDGTWVWHQKNYDFYNKDSFSLNKAQIIEFCKTANKSKAKYIENIRPTT